MKTDLSKYIDHTLLKADAKASDIARLCREAKEHGFASVCVNPCWVPKCREMLAGSGVAVCTVIGFPLGATSTFAKVEEALQAIEDGADELDVVLNQGLLKSDIYACFCELSEIVRECREAKKKVVLKLILECCNLTKDEIAVASTAAKKAGFDFVKTSTGFGKGGATVADVKLMRKTVGAKMGVKAAGGIRDRKTALAMIRAGATRLGCSCGMSLLSLCFAFSLFAGETRINAIGEKSREEIVAFFTDNEFGRRPDAAQKPALLRFDKVSEDKVFDGGSGVKMVRKQVRVVYGGAYATNSFPVTAFVPADAKGPVPAFLLVCNRAYDENCDPERVKKSPFFPVEEIVKRGFAAVSFYTWDVAPDYDTGNTQGVFAAFEKPGTYRNTKLWGTISAWAWGASRALDWLETVPEIDAKKVAVVGHSRGGKTALWAAVTDPRFAYACVNGSGCAGAKLNHLDLPQSEHIAQIVARFQYWFCLDYTYWANREREMPFDQHELLSCVAPRLLAVGSGSADHWAGPEGERKATELARAAWKDPSCVSYHCHEGKHDLGLFDWNIYLTHAENHWKGVAKTPPQTVDGREPTFECPISDAGCQFVFDEQASDEFEGETLDRSKWDDWVESFQGRRSGFLFSRDNVDVANGELKLKARLLREDEKTLDNLARGFDTYATAIVKSKKKTFYGYYECRAKSMKAAVCNAFWLYDPLSDEPKKKYRPGDFSEEIDIFEIFGKEGSKKSDCARAFYNTVHRLGTPYLEGRVLGSVENLPEKSSRRKVDFDFADGYHTYGFLWTEKEMKWYADDVEMFSRANDHFHRPMHVTFDCEIMYGWVGEPDKADLPQTFSVQYFRHWTAQ